MKRYYVRFESDEIVCGSNEHHYCNFSKREVAVHAAKRLKTEEEWQEVNARNIRVYDTWQDDENGHAKVIFEIA